MTSPTPATTADAPEGGPDEALRWRFGDLALLLGAYLLLRLVVSLALHLLGAATGVDFIAGDYMPQTNAAHVGDVATLLCWPLAIWWTVGRAGSPRRRPLDLTRPAGRHGLRVAATLCILLVLVKVPLAVFLANSDATAFPIAPAWLAPAPEALRGWGLLVSLLSTGLLVAVGEELTYRAVLYGWLRGHLPVTPAALLSALIFAATHPRPVMVFAFVAGIVLAWVYQRSGSLWPGIAVHAINNMTTVLLLAALTTTA